jgi:hypothetical protein
MYPMWFSSDFQITNLYAILASLMSVNYPTNPFFHVKVQEHHLSKIMEIKVSCLGSTAQFYSVITTKVMWKCFLKFEAFTAAECDVVLSGDELCENGILIHCLHQR